MACVEETRNGYCLHRSIAEDEPFGKRTTSPPWLIVDREGRVLDRALTLERARELATEMWLDEALP